MKPRLVAAALLGAGALVACEDCTPEPGMPAPQPRRSVEPIEEQPPGACETPSPYLDGMSAGLGAFRKSNDPVTTVPEEILPEATPETNPRRRTSR